MMKTQELSVTRVLRTLLPAAIVFALAACDQDGGTAQAPAPQVTEAVAAAPVGTAAASGQLRTSQGEPGDDAFDQHNCQYQCQ
jgi:predicted small lipoprotein YifL